MTITAARVEVLTAEVRVLMVGSRQVTLSVARQLDEVQPDEIEPFGRICTGRRKPFGGVEMIEVIGRADDGALVRSVEVSELYRCADPRYSRPEMSETVVNGREAISLRCADHQGSSYPEGGHFWSADPDWWEEWSELPLIVLAGLR
jgi:hypothetical protein